MYTPVIHGESEIGMMEYCIWMTSTSLNSVSMQKPNNVSTHSFKFLHLRRFWELQVLFWGQRQGSVWRVEIWVVGQCSMCWNSSSNSSNRLPTCTLHPFANSVLFNHAANAPLSDHLHHQNHSNIPGSWDPASTFGQGAKASSLSLSCCSSSLKWLVRSFNSLFSTCKPRFFSTKQKRPIRPIRFGLAFPANQTKKTQKKISDHQD